MTTGTLVLDRPSAPSTAPAAVERLAPLVLAAGFLFVAGIGAVNSFATVSARARAEGFSDALAWTLPAGVDGAIATFSAAGLWRAYRRQPIGWVRPLVYALVAGTIWLNVSAAEGAWGWVAHGILPALYVASVELVERIVRDVARLRASDGDPRIPLARWLLAPFSTAGIYRRMRLWGVTNYAEALELERSRILARCELRERYGSMREVPARERALYRLGHLTPHTHAHTHAQAHGPAVPPLQGEAHRSASPSARRDIHPRDAHTPVHTPVHTPAESPSQGEADASTSTSARPDVHTDQLVDDLEGDDARGQAPAAPDQPEPLSPPVHVQEVGAPVHAPAESLVPVEAAAPPSARPDVRTDGTRTPLHETVRSTARASGSDVRAHWERGRREPGRLDAAGARLLIRTGHMRETEMAAMLEVSQVLDQLARDGQRASGSAVGRHLGLDPSNGRRRLARHNELVGLLDRSQLPAQTRQGFERLEEFLAGQARAQGEG